MTLPGFELLYSSLQSQLRSPNDAIVSAIHWNIISAGFKLTSVGDDVAGPRQSTEVLPSGWNSGDIYILRYETTGSEGTHSYLLKILPVNGTLLLHMQRENEDAVVTLELPVGEFSTQDLSSVSTAFRHMDRLNSRVRENLINPAMGNSSSTQATAESSQATTSSQPEKKSSLLIDRGGQGGLAYTPRPMQPAWAGPPGMGGMGGMGGGMGGMGGGMGGMGGLDPFSVGRSDLDPLSGLGGPGGGMLMDPRYSGGPRPGPGGGFGGPSRGGGIHPGALPPGAVPPGARFDHFGPPGSRPGPDPDHEQPPSGYDDMFM